MAVKLYIRNASMNTTINEVRKACVEVFGDTVTHVEEEVVDRHWHEYKRYWIEVDESVPCTVRDKSLSKLHQDDTLWIGGILHITWVNHSDAFDPLLDVFKDVSTILKEHIWKPWARHSLYIDEATLSESGEE